MIDVVMIEVASTIHHDRLLPRSYEFRVFTVQPHCRSDLSRQHAVRQSIDLSGPQRLGDVVPRSRESEGYLTQRSPPPAPRRLRGPCENDGTQPSWVTGFP
jgi:hypothetical protein